MSVERGEKRNPINIEAIVNAVPPYKEFKTGAELQASSRQLVEDFPDLVASGFLTLDENFGTSTEGRPIELMTIGKGKKKAMWVGTPHPNEAVGTLAIDFLSRHLCEHLEITEQLDTTFVFIKNADPDGLALNESWLKGEMDPLKYALGFYRPPANEQVEYAFPIDYKTLRFTNSLAESQAIMKAFEKYKPHFYYSLHNSGFNAPYYNISYSSPDLFSPLRQVVSAQGLDLSTGEPDVPYQETYVPGIYKISSTKEVYDYFNATSDDDPVQVMRCGEKASEYLREHVVSDAFSLESEVPYFTADAFNDITPSRISKRDALLKGLKKSREILGFTAEQCSALEQKLPNSRLKRSMEWYIAMMNKNDASLIQEVKKKEYQEEATNAEVFHATQIESFYRSLWLGKVYRLALQAGEIGRAEEIKAYIEKVIDDINEVSPIKSVPLQKLVAIQVGAGLVTQQQLALGA